MSDLLPSRLTELEGVIERGLATFIEVGRALREIQDSRLYRERYATFEDYCRERWEFSRQRALQLIDGAAVTTTVVAEGLPAPANEAVARQLAPLRSDPEQLRAIWARAVERGEGRPTAVDVMAVKAELLSEPEPEGSEPGVRKLSQHRKMLASVAQAARHIDALSEHIEADVVSFIEGEERERWEQELRAARTALSRLIAALSSGG